MKVLLLLLFNLFSLSCFSQEVPKNYKLLEDKMGDLDKDGQPEKAAVYETSFTTEDGNEREIIIFKNTAGKWTIWKRSKNAVLKSGEGGMMGDPFQNIEIKKGILIINHYGGSSWKWGVTDKYRFQNDEFQLIGYTSRAGRLCEVWTNLDINLLTGQINYKKEYESCGPDETEEAKTIKTESETFYKKGIKITLQNRQKQEIKLISPKYKAEVYF